MTRDDTPSVSSLAAEVAELRARIDVLEASPRRAGVPRLNVMDLVSALQELVADGGSGLSGGVVVYAGVGPRGNGQIAWQMAHRWADVLAADRIRSGRALAALGNPARLEIVGELLAGPISRQELSERLDQSSAGQLNHHLRELLTAGLVQQPRRGVYEVRPHHVVPILTLLSCAIDLASDPSASETGPAET
jgi:DNA-binding transcriptional ArsR family regulator